jgi:hypothetical protein
VRVGVIAERVGNPDSTRRWQWACGFYPGSDPSEHARGIAETFDQARVAFEAAWRIFLAKRTEVDFADYRRDRASMLEADHVDGRTPSADTGRRRPGRRPQAG